jgi:DNA-binding GntR family transcriptional regulator
MGRTADPRTWVKVHAVVMGMIGDGTLKHGDRITVRAVAEALDTTQITTRKAFGKLCETGYLERRDSRFFITSGQEDQQPGSS